ncbi:hypothetical protein TorRG33x02_075960 [Trema orientale]|uniref:Uncharacterized protein n=1 Tax=Trema orientale TaxID=63057 RepID=A0A2P5FFN6_TREOI|nr:hypothetical protein TorRG33x02_075960 [Trema orientale]
MHNDSNSDTCPNGVQWSTLHPAELGRGAKCHMEK